MTREMGMEMEKQIRDKALEIAAAFCCLLIAWPHAEHMVNGFLLY